MVDETPTVLQCQGFNGFEHVADTDLRRQWRSTGAHVGFDPARAHGHQDLVLVLLGGGMNGHVQRGFGDLVEPTGAVLGQGDARHHTADADPSTHSHTSCM